ncbi:MAG: hypothetical protein FJX76_06515 [Armatimonadetes bacterium]|nr:hypothetical protein [Armatimonadota bacterium]
MDAIGGAPYSDLSPIGQARFIAPARLNQIAADLEMAQTLSGPQFMQLTAYLNVTVMSIDQCRFPQFDPAMSMLFGGAMDPMAIGMMQRRQPMSLMMALLMYQQMQLQMRILLMLMSQQGCIPPALLQQVLFGTQPPCDHPRHPDEECQEQYEQELQKAQEAGRNIDPERIAELTRIEEQMHQGIVGEKGPEALSPSGRIESSRDVAEVTRAFERKLQPALADAQKRGALKTIHERSHAEHTLRARLFAALADHLRKGEKDDDNPAGVPEL